MSGSWATSDISFLLVTFILVLGRQCSGFNDYFDSVEWWETSLIYEISPGAYEDSDGDGQGDLQGIISRLDYIEALGVQTICLNPIYPSPFIDEGYDVMDYKNIHPIFGNLSDFDELVEKIHERDMKIILDVIPNHSSDEHVWFMASIDRIDPYTDYYVWANGTTSENGTKVPPNNWLSAWDDGNDSAWTWNEERDQWYYHKYHESEPDLNFHNEDVRQEIMHILEFWLNREVDGFRIFGIPYLFEDSDLRDEPIISDPQYTFGLQNNIDFLYQIREFVDHWTEDNKSTSKLLVAGSCDTQNNSLSYYGGEDNSSPGIMPLNCLFTWDIDITSSNASEFENGIEEWLRLIPSNTTTNWMLPHDVMNSRIASRITSTRLDALHMLIMLLPGQAFTYYGDEIGINGITSYKITNMLFNNETRTEVPLNTPDSVSRVSMQWDDSTPDRISANESTNDAEENKIKIETNVEDQLHDPNSHLNVYKKLAGLRKDPVFERGDWNIESLNDDAVLLLRRSLPDHPVYVVIINLGDDQQEVNITELYPDLDDYFDAVLSTIGDVTNSSIVSGDDIDLLPNAALVLRSLQNQEEITTSEEAELGSTEMTTTDSMELTTWTEIDENTTMRSEIDEETTTESTTWSEIDEETTTESTTWSEIDEETATESTTWSEIDEETTAESTTWSEIDEETTTESTIWSEIDEETTTELTTRSEVDEETKTESTTRSGIDEETKTESTTRSGIDEETKTESTTRSGIDEETKTESTTRSGIDEETKTESTTRLGIDEATTIKSTTDSTDRQPITVTDVVHFENVATDTTTPNPTTSLASKNASYDKTLRFQMCISFAISYYFSKVW